MSVLVVSLDASQIAAADQKQQKVRIAVQQSGGTKSLIVNTAESKACKYGRKNSQVCGFGVDVSIWHLQIQRHSLLGRMVGMAAGCGS